MELDRVIGQYEQIRAERDRMDMSLKILRDGILNEMKERQIRQYDTEGGMRAQVTVQLKETISAKEAKLLLDEDTYRMMAKASETVVLIVKAVPRADKRIGAAMESWADPGTRGGGVT